MVSSARRHKEQKTKSNTTQRSETKKTVWRMVNETRTKMEIECRIVAGFFSSIQVSSKS